MMFITPVCFIVFFLAEVLLHMSEHVRNKNSVTHTVASFKQVLSMCPFYHEKINYV